MNKKILSLYILVMLFVFSIIPISFADTQTANAYRINTKTISLRIEGFSDNIFYDDAYKVTYTDDSLTVLDAVEQAVGKEDVTTITSYHGGKYISKINNEEECLLDNGEYAGWQYRVNGVESSNTVDQYIIDNNDRVVVYYGTLNSEYPIEEDKTKKLLSNEYILNNEKKKLGDIIDKRVDLLVSMGVIKGETDNNFYPENNITRAEFITLLAKLSKDEIKTNSEKVFSDTPVDEWYFNTVMWGYNKDIINGYKNRFEPDEFVTREDLAVMLIKYLERVEGYRFDELESQFADTKDMYGYSKSSIANLANLKLVNGKPNNRFDPKGYATRYETVIILTNFLDIKYGDVDFTSEK